MSNLLKKKEKGFTLIEIVLVLAIAGLLLVIVFLAVQGAQRSRRDSQRKQANARILAQLESYASNNAGVYPTSAAQRTDFSTHYMTGIQKPDGTDYTATWGGTVGTNTTTLAQDVVQIAVTGRTAQSCLGLEQGNACVNNQ